MPENTAVTDSDVTHSAGFTQVSKKKTHRFVLLLSCGQAEEFFILIREENLQTANGSNEAQVKVQTHTKDGSQDGGRDFYFARNENIFTGCLL